VEAENATTWASTHEDAEGLVRKIALLEGDLAEERRAQKLVKEISCSLSDMADAEHWWEVFEREHRVQLEELTLLQTRGSKLCLAIVGPPRVRNHLPKGMQLVALRHTEMVGELAALRAMVSSVVESVLTQ
jgi:hypothetical protein